MRDKVLAMDDDPQPSVLPRRDVPFAPLTGENRGYEGVVGRAVGAPDQLVEFAGLALKTEAAPLL